MSKPITLSIPDQSAVKDERDRLLSERDDLCQKLPSNGVRRGNHAQDDDTEDPFNEKLRHEVVRLRAQATVATRRPPATSPPALQIADERKTEPPNPAAVAPATSPAKPTVRPRSAGERMREMRNEVHPAPLQRYLQTIAEHRAKLRTKGLEADFRPVEIGKPASAHARMAALRTDLDSAKVRKKGLPHRDADTGVVATPRSAEERLREMAGKPTPLRPQ